MLGQTAIGAQSPHARSADPYRVLFDRLAAGAARCRPIVLANVRRIVERPHSRVAARSELGHRSTLAFALGMEIS
jgi:hypothetical protein